MELLDELFPLVRQVEAQKEQWGSELNRRCTAADTEARKKGRGALRH
jgi:hypothetical protein